MLNLNPKFLIVVASLLAGPKFLSYLLLVIGFFRLERLNPGCPRMYLPHSRPRDNCLAIVRKVGAESE